MFAPTCFPCTRPTFQHNYAATVAYWYPSSKSHLQYSVPVISMMHPGDFISKSVALVAVTVAGQHSSVPCGPNFQHGVPHFHSAKFSVAGAVGVKTSQSA